MKEKTKISIQRHIAKSITWRIIATGTTIGIAWAITGKIDLSIKIGIIEVILKTLLYFIHERVWYSFNFGIKGPRHSE